MSRQSHDELVAAAFDTQADTFNRSGVANAEEILGEMVSLAAPRHQERWLEAACGPGVVSRRFAPAAGTVHGIDLSPAMIELARREASAAELDNITFEVGDATATGHAAAGYDGAVTRFSVHHLPLPARLLDELARVVSPGGRILVVDHVADEDGAAAAWSQEIERLRDPSHWACLPASRLRRLGERAGLTLDAEREFGFELDFDDWLDRGGVDTAGRELIEHALTGRPTTAECFGVDERDGRRVLRLRMWLGRYRTAGPPSGPRTGGGSAAANG